MSCVNTLDFFCDRKMDCSVVIEINQVCGIMPSMFTVVSWLPVPLV